ncbi:TIGR04053 family radical SAM/SPASM domain-containing protein [Halalkalibacter alkaliphilus]|uniref:TIGR04053 family radical SAM/SPASM domain-containing protein n=1 Tax=Halalkalibacter alkaliphilus TaxID=2917993 RepID=A0A9X2I9Y8_9BACI|nr:TIGR04053 family radical SAM/SPASM domain-containing protein [Halalkalibacter alkaliphilus]MCL7749739.1 TIGR04053 family radical SAM/SPASM domain-containing protein [Halalkalibacter alkaliphilus]
MNIDYKKNPFIVIWEVTRACALKCLHCRAEAQHLRDPRELSFEEGTNLIDQIYEMGNPLLVFTGGDPLMREDLYDLIDYAVKKGVRVSMTPSATPRVTKKAMEKAKAAGLSRWAFSLDGPNKEIHDHFRGTKGSFDLTMKAIRHLQDLNMPIQINTVVSHYNVDELEKMAELMEQLGTVLWSVFFLVPTGRASNMEPISPERHEQVLHWLAEIKDTATFDIKTTEAPHFRRVLMQRESMKAKGERQEKRRKDILGRAPKGVNDGNGFVFISHIGDVFPSGFLPIHCGNVRSESLAAIYRENSVFKQLREPDQFKGKCGDCEYRNLCGGSRARAYAVTGDYLQGEPYCIYIPKQKNELAETQSL